MICIYLGVCLFYCYVEDYIENIPSENELSPKFATWKPPHIPVLRTPLRLIISDHKIIM